MVLGNSSSTTWAFVATTFGSTTNPLPLPSPPLMRATEGPYFSTISTVVRSSFLGRGESLPLPILSSPPCGVGTFVVSLTTLLTLVLGFFGSSGPGLGGGGTGLGFHKMMAAPTTMTQAPNPPAAISPGEAPLRAAVGRGGLAVTLGSGRVGGVPRGVGGAVWVGVRGGDGAWVGAATSGFA